MRDFIPKPPPQAIVNAIANNDSLDYDMLYNMFGIVIAKFSTEGYYGDTIVIYDLRDGKWGYLRFGWGSCTVCDAWEGIRIYADYENETALARTTDLVDDLHRSIVVFDSSDELMEFVKNHDYEGDGIEIGDQDIKSLLQNIKFYLDIGFPA